MYTRGPGGGPRSGREREASEAVRETTRRGVSPKGGGLRRVFTQGKIVKFLSGGRESSDLASYLRRNPLISNELIGGATIPFKVPGVP